MKQKVYIVRVEGMQVGTCATKTAAAILARQHFEKNPKHVITIEEGKV